MPGFIAEASLSTTEVGRYQSVATQSHSSGGQGVVAQIRAGGGAIRGGGGRLGFWCEAECAAIAALCIAGTEGIGIAECIAAEIVCSQGCGSVSGGQGGVIIA